MPVVSIIDVKDDAVEAAVKKAVDLSGGLSKIIGPESRVLIKPNIMQPVRSGCGLITDVRITEAITRLILELNPTQVIIGEGASVGYDFPNFMDTKEAFEVSGTSKMAQKLGVTLVDLNRDTQVEVEIPQAFVMNKFRIAKTALEADVIISVPCLKTHVRTGVTASLKNMKGVLPGLEKRRTHQTGLDRAIVDLNRVVKPDFALVDAVNCMEGTWKIPDDIVQMNLVVAGTDPVSVDSVCAKIIGLSPAEVMHITLAEEEGLGIADLNRIDIKGSKIEIVAKKFKPYREVFARRFKGVKLLVNDACTGCMGEAVSTLIYLQSAGFKKEMEELVLVIGQPKYFSKAKEKKAVIIGQCASKYGDLGVYVQGCPPHGYHITKGACKALGIDEKTVQKAIEKLHSLPDTWITNLKKS